MINMKKQAFNAAAILALTASAASHAGYVDLPNGSFDATADMGTFISDSGSTVTFETTGGNPGGFGLASNTAGGWGGGFVAVANAAEDAIPLSDYGLSGGDSVNIRFDVKDFNGDGAGVTGIKMESWSSATTGINDTGDVHFTQSDSNWNTIVYNYTFDAAATHFKAVLVGTNAGEVGFDNFQIDAVATVPVPAAAWLFGSALAGLVAVRRKK